MLSKKTWMIPTNLLPLLSKNLARMTFPWPSMDHAGCLYYRSSSCGCSEIKDPKKLLYSSLCKIDVLPNKVRCIYVLRGVLE
uniref:Uncharacterized protein n=1 Tax=Ditylenchus dipsaci TaxID=166011 RepID=A0A915DE32_9BILA